MIRRHTLFLELVISEVAALFVTVGNASASSSSRSSLSLSTGTLRLLEDTEAFEGAAVLALPFVLGLTRVAFGLRVSTGGERF